MVQQGRLAGKSAGDLPRLTETTPFLFFLFALFMVSASILSNPPILITECFVATVKLLFYNC